MDLPTPILFWDPVVFVSAVSFMGFGIVSNLWVLGMAGAAGILVGANKLQRGTKQGAAAHFLWRIGIEIEPELGRSFPRPWQTEFIE